jgi:phosphate starvation-inducible protein PhoH and related proteins
MTQHETLHFDDPRTTQALFANEPRHLKLVEDAFHVKLSSRENWIRVDGETAGIEKAKLLFNELRDLLARGGSVTRRELRYLVETIEQGGETSLKSLIADRIDVSPRKRPVVPKTFGQQRYVAAMRSHDIVFGIGPAGTGKTYLAMAVAVSELLRGKVSRIILTRPAVEAGETLGFLPGTLHEKVMPYLRPLYDALYDMMEPEEIQRNMDRGVIEIAPLAYMRGRTLNNSFVILDEAQNTTSEQMMMFLTRMGFDSRSVITGDVTQIDLPSHKVSGLVEVETILKDLEGIAITYFTEHDVVRHELVQKIIRAYQKHKGAKGPRRDA